MFKRGDTFVMDMDVEPNFEEVDRMANEKGLDLAEIHEKAEASLLVWMERAAKDAVRESGQKWKEAGLDPNGQGAGPALVVRFQGDTEGAAAAYGRWADIVASLDGTKRILRARLQGSEGTNLNYMDEDYQKELEGMFDALPQDPQDWIDREMDPDQTPS